MDYAIIKTGGKQYRVSKDDVIEVEKLNFKPGESFTIQDVLLYVKDNNLKIGKPKLTDVGVKATVLEQVRGEKLRVSKFKAKSKYRRVTGHRQYLTKIKILDLLTSVKN